MTTTVETTALSPAQHDRLRRIIHERTGVRLRAVAREEMAERLRPRLDALNFDDFDQYATFLTIGPHQRDELEEALCALSVSDSSFFHDADQLHALQQHVLPGLIAACAPVRRLRVWCAGCGTGQEAYTLSMVVQRALGPRAGGWHVDVLGTDISARALDTAVRGEYSADEAQRVPSPWREQLSVHGQTCTPSADAAACVNFEHHHLGDRLGAKRFARWDLIVCRRVLPLFDDALQARVIAMFADQLSPGGVLVLGRGDQIPAAYTLLQPITPDGTLGYTLPGARQHVVAKAA